MTIHRRHTSTHINFVPLHKHQLQQNIWQHFQYSLPPQRIQLNHTANYLLLNRAQPALKYHTNSRAPYLKHRSGHPVSACVCLCVSWLWLSGSLSKYVLVLHRPPPSVRHCSNQTTEATVNPLSVAVLLKDFTWVCECWERRSDACLQPPG